MLPCGHRKDLVQFLKRQGFRLWQEQQYKEPKNQAPSGIPSKRTLRLECRQQRGPCEAEDKIKAPSRRCRKRHSDLTDMQREGFSAVGEWDGTHAWGVEDFEQVHAGCDHSNSLRFQFPNPEGEASPKQEDG